jgi:CubicO group peptidase (beta-lactamase class C family)
MRDLPRSSPHHTACETNVEGRRALAEPGLPSPWRRPRASHVVRVAAIVGLSAALVACSTGQALPSPDYWPTQAWRTSTPEAQGLDSARLAEGLLAIRAKNLPIHSLLLVRNGDLFLDASFYPYDGLTVHDLASVTKSVTTALVGIAADQGKLRLDDPIVSFFPDRTIANLDARKGRITVRHLASMSSGLDCTAANGEQTLSDMKASTDWVQFALDLPASADPGSVFSYCSPGMHLLSAILQQATGMTELDFAREYLFAPLGITDVSWATDPQGYTHGWGDLYLRPRDAAKLGYLWANGGVWDGRQLVSREWVQDSVTVQMKTGEDDDYGYGWWLPTKTTTGEYAAEGRGGQRIAVHRDLNLIVVITGEGVEPGDATDLLAPALADPEKPLPANPDGVEKLTAALEQIADPPATQPVPPFPATAAEISGKTWAFEANSQHLQSVRFDFSAGTEAAVEIMFDDGRPAITGQIGLDGKYRFSPGRDGLPSGFRGYWAGPTTFAVDFDEVANNHAYDLRFDFGPDRLTLMAQDRTEDAGFSVGATATPKNG